MKGSAIAAGLLVALVAVATVTAEESVVIKPKVDITPKQTDRLSWLTLLLQSFLGSNNLGSSTFLTTAPATSAPQTSAPQTSAPQTSNTGSCRCGIKLNNVGRIMGGINSEVGEFPWQVGFLSSPSSNGVFCGGVIINNQWILTAAHCTISRIPNSFAILVGGFQISDKTPPSKIVFPSQIINHPGYVRTRNSDDIALVRMSETLDFNSQQYTVAPICLPVDDSNLYENVQAVVTGWGRTFTDGPATDIMNEVTLQTVTNNFCSNAYGSTIPSTEICANVNGGGKDSCQGDSGGPLVTLSSNNYELIGIVSSGAGCGLADFPGIYTRVSKYLDWIASNTRGAQTCPR